jgi:hypothetical protein
MSQPPTPPGSPGQPVPQRQPQPWPQQGMQPPVTDAASTTAGPAEKARRVGWAEWAASTTFSSSGLISGYDKQEVDAFRRAVRDTFLGVRKPP